MIRFHNAVDTDGKVINIKEVTRENRARQYFCIGCGAEMSAVLGEKREHHFRHKEAHCSWESYLHQLSKKRLKERFDKQEEFNISYYVEYVCEKSDGCRLGLLHSKQSCNRRELRTVDLKRMYDTCEEEVCYNSFRADLMLSNSKQPDRKPLFLEISVTHDCEPEKLALGIEIIELKITDEDDTQKPLTEQASLFVGTSANPYQCGAMPPIRFYNFQRSFMTKRPLQRFWISKDERGVTRANCIQDDLNCRNVETYHREDSLFEVAIPMEIVIGGERPNIMKFGMMRAFRNKIDIRHCCFCISYQRCICTLNVETTDKRTGDKRIVPQRFWTARLTKIDKFAIASGCKNYYPDKLLIARIGKIYGKLPYWEWDRDAMYKMLKDDCPF